MDYVKESYELAKKRYAQYGIDTDQVIETLKKIPISMHCWQGDDVIGFEDPNGELTGGIQTTGNYPGKARTPDELRSDIEKAFSMIPGKHRINLHAVYGDFEGDVERDKIEPKHFKKWVEWAKKNGIALDFNPTCFSHPMSESGMTLSHPDKEVRDFWIRHCKACREIAAYMGKELGSPAVTNFWFPDGMKDITVDKYGPRKRLLDGLDEIFSVKYPKEYILDAVESKVFGIGDDDEANKATLAKYYDELSSTLGETLLTPTRIYVKPVLAAIQAADVKAISHITGGGFYENIPRMLKEGMSAKIEKAAVPVRPIFDLIQKVGNIPERDMFNTFNMGVGLCMAVSKETAQNALDALNAAGEEAVVLGEVVEGGEEVVLC